MTWMYQRVAHWRYAKGACHHHLHRLHQTTIALLLPLPACLCQRVHHGCQCVHPVNTILLEFPLPLHHGVCIDASLLGCSRVLVVSVSQEWLCNHVVQSWMWQREYYRLYSWTGISLVLVKCLLCNTDREWCWGSVDSAPNGYVFGSGDFQRVHIDCLFLIVGCERLGNHPTDVCLPVEIQLCDVALVYRERPIAPIFFSYLCETAISRSDSSSVTCMTFYLFNPMWVADFDQGILRFAVAHCAMCTFKNVPDPFVCHWNIHRLAWCHCHCTC